MILKKESNRFQGYDIQTFVSTNQLLGILEKYNEFKDELVSLYNADEVKVLKIGNAKHLLDSINLLDSKCEKIDILSKIKDIQLKRIMDEEKALFEIFSVSDKFLLKKNKSDLLIVETRYSAKTDLLDYYNFSKFANYCRDEKYDDLIATINEYLKIKNSNNEELRNLRLIYKNDDDNPLYLRSVTSSHDYKNFGINFSVFVALMSLNAYVESSKNEIFIDDYVVDDSNLYVSFSLNKKIRVNNELDLSFNLILENDEIKRKAVSFNGIFKLKFEKNNKSSEIYLKPKGIVKKEDIKKEGLIREVITKDYPVDLLSYPHRGSVENVINKIKDLPLLIEHFIEQVSEDSKKISKIANPNDIRLFIIHKIKYSKNLEFKIYKDKVQKKLQSITVDNIFGLFELLREVEDLFDHDDIVSRNFWRTKLYESLIERK